MRLGIRTEVFIVYEGELAQAQAHGARLRIVERREDFFRPSRALTLHPRTLEEQA
jgi:hypothetical protein